MRTEINVAEINFCNYNYAIIFHLQNHPLDMTAMVALGEMENLDHFILQYPEKLRCSAEAIRNYQNQFIGSTRTRLYAMGL